MIKFIRKLLGRIVKKRQGERWILRTDSINEDEKKL